MSDVATLDADLTKGHSLLRVRLPQLLVALEKQGVRLKILEVFRTDERQKWLYAQGRTRPGVIITNASSALTSPHGHMENCSPASCAVDLLPNEPNPWQDAVFWSNWIGPLEKVINQYGLRHFHAPGKAVWDQPHLQLIEWSDSESRLIL